MDLNESMQRRPQRRSYISQLTKLLDVGVVWLDPELRPDVCSERALELLGEPADAEVLSAATLRTLLRRLGLGTGRWKAQVEQDSAAPDSELRKIDLDLDTADGTRRLRLQLHGVPEDECQLSYLILIRDRSVLDAIESDLRMAAKLRSLNHLYRGVAHDLKAPLNAMRLNLDLLSASLQQSNGDGPPVSAGESLQVVEQELQRLQRSLQQLLEQTAPAQAQRETFEFGQLVKDIVSFMRPEAEQRRVTIDLQLPADLVPLHTHRDSVHQIIVNLAVNALEAMQDGGHLTFALQRTEKEGILRVSDTGPGVSPKLRRRIFDMHFTTKSGDNNGSSGTGIGLHVSLLAARRAGGRLTLLTPDDTNGGGATKAHTMRADGATFELRLPMLQE